MDFSPRIIVLGNQKSGTTAIASLLADYGGLSKTIDIPELWKMERDIHAGKLSIEAFIASNSHRFSSELVKEPCLTFLYDELVKIFPDTRYVFVIRHPADNIRSILDRFNVPCNLDQAEIDIPEHMVGWRNLFDGSLLKIHHKHYVARLAMRWVISTEIYLKNKDKIFLIRYEDFMQDKYGCIKRAAHALEVEKKHDIMPFLDRQYQSKGISRGLPFIESFGEKNTGIIKELCGPYLDRF